MNFILKKRSFVRHLILFFITAGLWFIIYVVCYITNKRNSPRNNIYETIYKREKLQEQNDILDIEIKKEKLKELKLKNKKLENSK